MSDYTPIDCGLYSRYELAILRRQRLRVAWRDPDGACHLETLLPVNLQTREHAEYLLAKTGGDAALEIRLDRIIRAEPC
jgi:Rho-binding antiterminator